MTSQSSKGSAAHRFTKRHDFYYELPADASGTRHVPARVYADDTLWEQIQGDQSLEQLANTATLPGVTGRVCAMPDVHQGYGFPVGGVAGFRTSDGIISPGGVGYDINCGVRLLAANLDAEEVTGHMESLVHELSRSVPAGAGRGSSLRLTDRELDRVFTDGCGYLVERGLAVEPDVAHTEANGAVAGADPDRVSSRARDRGRDQLGTSAQATTSSKYR